jgi:large subunit ribosomal protein L14e
MAVLEVGRVCMKIAGREAGKYCVVIKPAGKDKDEKSFVLVSGPKMLTGVKRRKANTEHLKATEHKIDIPDDAADDQIFSAYEKVGLIAKLGLKKPSAAQMKSAVESKKEKEGKVEKKKGGKKDDKKKKS